LSLELRWTAAGKEAERTLTAGSLAIGRDAGNGLVLDDRSVSRRHARIEWDGRAYRVEDLFSVNGVRVNDVPLTPGPAGARPLANGDVLKLGNVTVRVAELGGGQASLSYDAGTPVTLSRPTDFDALAGRRAPPVEGTIAAHESAGAARALRLLAALSRRMVAAGSSEEMLEAVLSLVLDSTPAERAALLLWDDVLKRLVPRGVRSRRAAGESQRPIPASLVSRAYQDRCVVRTRSETVTDLSASMKSLGVGSAIAVPLGDDARCLGALYVDSPVPGDLLDDFGIELLSAVASHAAVALEQERLQQRLRHEERARARLERYVDRAVADEILAAGETSGRLGLRAQSAEVTVLFCDMANFTGRSETLEPEDVMLLVNRYFSRMTEVVFDHQGTLDKYIGDCVMAVFGAPRPQPDHARRAARAALGLRDAVRQLAAGAGAVEVRIGLNSGRVVAGDVGHALRREWTVLGATVNLASRMEGVARAGQIVLTGETRALLGEGFETRAVELAQRPKGIIRDVTAWELLGERT
jgi:adenylate cyclase